MQGHMEVGDLFTSIAKHAYFEALNVAMWMMTMPYHHPLPSFPLMSTKPR